MAKSKFPWRNGRSLAAVLAESRPWLQSKRIIREGGGCRASALAAAGERLGQPLPPDIHQFLLALKPIPMFENGAFSDDGPSEFFFYGPLQPELRWEPLAEWEPKADWAGARGLAFGQTAYGDGLYWVIGHRTQPDGCIAVFDHELAMGDLMSFVIARSLPEFISKVVHARGLSPGDDDDMDDFEDDDADLLADIHVDVENLRLFAKEYAELNPTSAKLQDR